MQLRKWCATAIVASSIVGIVATIPVVGAEATTPVTRSPGPRAQYTTGTISAHASKLVWCVTAMALKENGNVNIARCTGAPNQRWLMTRGKGFLIVTSGQNSTYCLGANLESNRAVLQDCATENAHGSLLRYEQINEENEWLIMLINDKCLSVYIPPKTRNPKLTYPAIWQVEGQGPAEVNVSRWSLPTVWHNQL